MDLKEKIIGILINVIWLLLGAFLNIFYPNMLSINSLLPNFLLVISVFMVFSNGFLGIAPLVVIIGLIDSIWRGINPGVNVLSLIGSLGIVYLFFHRLWGGKWVIVTSIFLVTILYFFVSFLLIYLNKLGIFTINDALNFGVTQGIYNSICGIVILLLFRKFFKINR
ncbi:MAG: hypothetical protein N2380_08440 [bacterium]|nr:hypothetical protein [bacterium]